MSVYRIVPERLRFVRADMQATAILPVARVETAAAGSVSFLKRDCTPLTVTPTITGYHPMVRGVSHAEIGPDLRMHVKLYPGCEHDELLRDWPKSEYLRAKMEA